MAGLADRWPAVNFPESANAKTQGEVMLSISDDTRRSVVEDKTVVQGRLRDEELDALGGLATANTTDWSNCSSPTSPKNCCVGGTTG